MKITDSQYRLPLIEALSAFELMDTGTTEPMAIWGVNKETGERGKFVVKFINSPRMSPKSSSRELLGCWIANELDIKVVEPVIVNISQDFANTIAGQKGYQSALKSLGHNFGSVYEEGYSLFPNTNFKLNASLMEQAKALFMFDMFIENADRGGGKPNVLSNGRDLLVLDHELAFSFTSILPFLRNKKPWLFGDTEKELYISHYLYPFLHGQEIDFKPFTEKLVVINDSFWERAQLLIPDSWKTDEIQDITSHLNLIVKNRQSFSEQLTKILAV